MSVRKLKENKITKDGRSWVFIQYSKGLDGKRHQYQSKAYMTEEEAIQAEKIYLNKYKDVEFNPHMTFKEAYTIYYDYQNLNKLGLYLVMIFLWLLVECIFIEINMLKKLE